MITKAQSLNNMKPETLNLKPINNKNNGIKRKIGYLIFSL